MGTTIYIVPRFVYDGKTGGVQKLMKAVQFTVDLEIPKVSPQFLDYKLHHLVRNILADITIVVNPDRLDPELFVSNPHPGEKLREKKQKQNVTFFT